MASFERTLVFTLRSGEVNVANVFPAKHLVERTIAYFNALNQKVLHPLGRNYLVVSRAALPSCALGNSRLITRFHRTNEVGSTNTTSRALSSKPSASA